MDQYEPASIEDNVWIYIKIQKGMPGLKQAGKIAKNRWKISEKSLYEPLCHTPALWTYASHEIVFTLVVDNFGVKYENRKDLDHLRNDLQILYPVTTY